MPSTSQHPETTRSAVKLWSVGVLFVAMLAVIHIAAQPLLLTFAGVLFGCALRGLAEAAADRTRWPVKLCLAGCVALLLLLAVVAGLRIIPNVGEQAVELADRLVRAYRDVHDAIRGSRLDFLLPGDGAEGLVQRVTKYVPRIAGFLASGVGALGAVLVVAFLALYIASAPEIYKGGIVSLFPVRHRERGSEVLRALATTLRRWLLGRVVSMLAVGISTAILLSLLGIPLPLTLGLLAGALGFVANIGPIVSAVPALLLASTIDPLHVLYVFISYVAVNLIDGYVLTPAIQQRAVAVPPALILSSQLILGALWGLLGLTFATPLVACLIVLVRELYVKDVLEGRMAKS